MWARPFLLGMLMVTVGLVGCITTGSLAENPTSPCGELEDGFDLEEAEPFNPRVEMSTSKGTIELVVYQAQVPFTAGTFLTFVDEERYNETRFHQIRDSFIQGGDPNSRADHSPQLWGSGGQAEMPNEFHQFLRHDEAGVMSIAAPQPHMGGSQFIITLQPLPGLNDRHDVFARITDGMDILREIAEVETDEHNRPVENAKLHSVDRLPAEKSPEEGNVELSAYGFDCEQAAEPNGTAEFLIAVRNTGTIPMDGTFEADLPDPAWSAEVRDTDSVILASGQTRALPVDIHVPEDAEHGTYTIDASFQDGNGDATTSQPLTVNVGPLGSPVEAGDTVSIEYVGMLQDARPFDTTQPAYVDEPSLTWFQEPEWFNAPEDLAPVPVDVGSSGLIPGLDDLLERAQHGQSVTALIPPHEAYGTDDWGDHNLGGRTLAFQLHVLEDEG